MILYLLVLARTEFAFLALYSRKAFLWVVSALLTLYALTGSPVSPNSWAVFYISLGQLPGNSWGIVYADSTALRVDPQAWYHPYTFNRMALQAIAADPGEYVRKCAYNLTRIVHDGVWSGMNGTIGKVLAVGYGVVFWLMLIAWCGQRGGKLDDTERFVALLCLGIIAGQMLGQQMSRHTTVLYLPVLGMASEWAARSMKPYQENA